MKSIQVWKLAFESGIDFKTGFLRELKKSISIANEKKIIFIVPKADPELIFDKLAFTYYFLIHHNITYQT